MRFLLIALMLMWCQDAAATNSSLDFDEANDEIFNTAVANIDTNAFSSSQWEFRDSSTGADSLLNTGSAKSSGNNALNMIHQNDDSYRCSYRWSTDDGLWDTDNTFAINAWHHVMCVYDSGGTNNDAKIWIDGIDEAITEAQAPSGTAKSGLVVITAGENVGGGQDFPGQMAYIEFFAGTLFAEYEVNEIKWKPISLGQSEVAWPMWDTGGQDLSGNGETFTTGGNPTADANGPPVMFGGGLPL